MCENLMTPCFLCRHLLESRSGLRGVKYLGRTLAVLAVLVIGIWINLNKKKARSIYSKLKRKPATQKNSKMKLSDELTDLIAAFVKKKGTGL